LSVLTKLEVKLSSIFPFTRSNLSPIMMSLLLKITKMIHSGVEVGFIWCPAHIRIEGNDLTDRCAKSAALTGVQVVNLVSCNVQFSGSGVLTNQS